MTAATPGQRIERDSMGEVAVPASARWGAQTQRAVENFPVSGRPVDPRLVHAVALIKAHAAEVNASLVEVAGVDIVLGTRIAQAAREVAAGAWDHEFPIDAFQTGSATSTNMNVNEVVANLASERGGRAVHPNDHVNASQSSNDVIPSAVRLAAASAVVGELLPAMRVLRDLLVARAEDFAAVVKAGRTHWMDATPVTLGQEFGGYAAQVEESLERLDASLPRLCRLPLGGTATGTGLNCPSGFAAAVVEGLARETGLPLVPAPDRFATQGAADAVAELSSHLRTFACTLSKVAGDLRAMASGPRTGLGEIRLPALQPGSSIMPGKVNPVIPEVVLQVVAQVVGNDAAVAFACTQGSFELLTYQPLLARNLLESVTLLARACTLLATRCVAGIEADAPRCRSYAEATPAVATALNPLVGYERAADIVKESMATGRAVRDLIVEAGLVERDRVDEVLDVLALTRAGLR